MTNIPDTWLHCMCLCAYVPIQEVLSWFNNQWHASHVMITGIWPAPDGTATPGLAIEQPLDTCKGTCNEMPWCKSPEQLALQPSSSNKLQSITVWSTTTPCLRCCRDLGEQNTVCSHWAIRCVLWPKDVCLWVWIVGGTSYLACQATAF
jgi:hypothetical protein